MFKMMGLIVLVPASVLLALSFFVLLVLSKMEKGRLRLFGYAVVAVLWIVSASLFSAGFYKVFACNPRGGCSMQEMRGKMGGMMKGPQQGAPMMREQTDNPGMRR